MWLVDVYKITQSIDLEQEWNFCIAFLGGGTGIWTEVLMLALPLEPRPQPSELFLKLTSQKYWYANQEKDQVADWCLFSSESNS
jgi:hypothetical protein